MKYYVIPRAWNERLGKYVVIPLDDADVEIIQLASLVHGHDLTPKQFNQAITRLGISRDKIGY